MTKALLVLVLVFISACAGPTPSFENKAIHKGLSVDHIQGQNFIHTIFGKNLSNKNKTLHVYLGGDGTPWFEGRYATRDPTPLKPVMLDLMQLDQNPSIYLGRPCYHQKVMPNNCNKLLWTYKRYSPVIVQSMVVALRNYIRQHGYSKVRLFGFSGGGTLAMLLAARLNSVEAIVTISGNLDIEAWTRHHNYLPLTGSLNPAKEPSLPVSIKQIHIAGGRDSSVPSFIIKAVSDQQPKAQYILLENADHHCCWKAAWPSVLKMISLR